VRPLEAKAKDKAAIYCLNVHQLASIWARQHLPPGANGGVFAELNNAFLYETKPPFSNGYESGVLKYFGMPASWNRRMQRQHGVFLYDTVDYSQIGYKDLEDYLIQA